MLVENFNEHRAGSTSPGDRIPHHVPNIFGEGFQAQFWRKEGPVCSKAINVLVCHVGRPKRFRSFAALALIERLDPGVFLREHLESVVQDRLPANPRMYGGYESTRRLSIELLDSTGTRVAAVREPYNRSEGRSSRLEAPFEGYQVRVGVTSSAPAVWTQRFVLLVVAFIGLMGLVILLATIFGLRYTVRQLELAQLKSGFVSNVTHELKTPIALIRLAVETLEMGRFRSP